MSIVDPERVLALFDEASGGMTVQQLNLNLGYKVQTVNAAVVRLYDCGKLIRLRGTGRRYRPFVYAAASLEPARASVRPRTLSPQASAALRVVKQLAHPSAAALAAQHGCSYPLARKLWAELVESGAVSA